MIFFWKNSMEGPWTDTLADFLLMLAIFVKEKLEKQIRIQQEFFFGDVELRKKEEEERLKTLTPEERTKEQEKDKLSEEEKYTSEMMPTFLTFGDVSSFIESFLVLALKGIFSKSQDMRISANHAIKNCLCYNVFEFKTPENIKAFFDQKHPMSDQDKMKIFYYTMERNRNSIQNMIYEKLNPKLTHALSTLTETHQTNAALNLLGLLIFSVLKTTYTPFVDEMSKRGEQAITSGKKAQKGVSEKKPVGDNFKEFFSSSDEEIEKQNTIHASEIMNLVLNGTLVGIEPNDMSKVCFFPSTIFFSFCFLIPFL